MASLAATTSALEAATTMPVSVRSVSADGACTSLAVMSAGLHRPDLRTPLMRAAAILPQPMKPSFMAATLSDPPGEGKRGAGAGGREALPAEARDHGGKR